MVIFTMFARKYTKIESFLSKDYSILVLGPRGTGKTYFLTRLLKEQANHMLIDLLDKSVFPRYLKDPSLFYKEIKSRLTNTDELLWVMIDEVQLVPSLLDEVHRLIEAYKKQVVFILTGSSARKLRREEANLLAGRALRIDFFPLGMDELDYDLEVFLQWGTLPSVLNESDPVLREAYLKTYVGTYLDEELRKEANIRNLSGFARFLELAAAENGQLVNYSKLAKSAGVADVTVKEYFQILNDTLLAYHIPAWSYSKREQLQIAPKNYIFDNGVVNALLGELRSTPNRSTYRFGRLFENFVLGQIVQYKSKQDCNAKIYHYRQKKGKEIDFILQKNPHSAPVAVEIKSTSSPSVKDVNQLLDFGSTYPKSKLICICNTPEDYIDSEIEFLGVNSGIARIFDLTE